MCGTYEGSAPAGEWVEVTCSSNAHGRYLIIQIPGARQILTLCEVQVFGGRWININRSYLFFVIIIRCMFSTGVCECLLVVLIMLVPRLHHSCNPLPCTLAVNSHNFAPYSHMPP